MGLFREEKVVTKLRPQIRVIKVRNEVREVEEVKEHRLGYGGVSDKETKITKKVNVTIVLLVKNGELVTREFNGKWDMEDVKEWEDL